MNDGYLRQRRNLISISLILLLIILGGATKNPLYPYQLERPYVAIIFSWIGFFYFWYRTKIYTPINIFTIFKNEIILSYIIKHNPANYNAFNLSSFIGIIKIVDTVNSDEYTTFSFTGTTKAVTNPKIDNIRVRLNQKHIINKINYFKNIFAGKVITDYFLPHVLAVVTFILGIYKYCWLVSY